MEGQEYKVRDMLILEDDRKKKVKRGKDNFVIKAIFPKDQKAIARQLALEYNGLPISSFSMEDRNAFDRDVTLDVMIDDSPDWWTTSEDCPDGDLKEWLYQEILSWSAEFQEKLKKNKAGRRSTEAPVSK